VEKVRRGAVARGAGRSDERGEGEWGGKREKVVKVQRGERRMTDTGERI